MRRAAAGELAPWLWINVITSTLTTACIAWYVTTRIGAWWRLVVTRRVEFTREDQLVLVFAATLAANAMFGFAYTRDVMMSPAGLLYALAAFVAFDALLNRAAAGGLPIRALAVTALLAISIGWSIRTVGLTYVLRETAFIRRNDWAMGIERLQRNNQLPNTEAARTLAFRLRYNALTAHVPNHWLAQPGVDKYFDKAF